MRVAFNALSAQQGGGVSVLINLLPQLASIDRKNAYFIFYSPEQSGLVRAIPDQFRKIAVHYLPRNPYVRVLWEQFVFPFYLLWYRVDALYSGGNTTSIFAPCKVVLLIENANPYSLFDIQWTPKERLRNMLLRFLGWLSARRATTIRFVSENSRKLIVPQLKVAPEKCVVIPHGVSLSMFGASASAGSKAEPPHIKNYLLTIGANALHRNLERLLRAFALLNAEYGYQGRLIVLGTLGSASHRAALLQLTEALGLREQVVFQEEVPHHEVSAYLTHAEALAFPSIEETFGIPLLEAMASGVPVAASDCDLDALHRGKCFNPFREICADVAEYFNPFDVQDMAQCMHRVLTDAALREQLITRGKERVKKYNLEHTARALVQLFENVYNGNQK